MNSEYTRTACDAIVMSWRISTKLLEPMSVSGPMRAAITRPANGA